MKFEEMPLRVPSTKAVEKKFKCLKEELINAKDAKTAIRVVKKYFRYSDELESDCTIISIRYSIDTRNEEYVKAKNAIDNIMPIISGYNDDFLHAVVASKYKEEMVKEFGQLFFDQTEAGFKCFDEKIIPDLIEENKLTSEYDRVLASAQIEFNGEIYNLTQLGKFLSDKDKDVRVAAAKKFWGFMEEKDAEIGEIYDKLVQIRTSIATKLGFENFTELAYLRLGRLDYNAQMVETYRNQIKRDVVPVVKKLRARQAKRLQIKSPTFLDYNLEFLSGNPAPIGDSKYLVECAQKMYSEMSEESGKFFSFMVENNLMDLDAKAGKAGGGYMTFIPRYKSPFIFANSNGTKHDVDTLTHEVGHAFQGDLGANIKVPSYRMPTLEACEIDSMSMEFFAWPWMELFFGDLADKYRFSHLDGAISFLPYGAEVDEFQHFVYAHPEWTHKDRCKKWAELEKEYRPWLNFKGFDYLENGHMWMKQSHIFQTPFYYIDYTLAQVLALEFKCEMDKNYDKAWEKYVKLLKMGGKYPFLTLLKKDKLRNPFIEGNVIKVIKPQIKVLNSFDDSKF